MLSTKLARPLIVSALLAAPVHADPAPALADLAARIDYGFYAADERVIDAARAALDRLPDDELAVRYHRAFAALRSAQLRPPGAADTGALLQSCVEDATPRRDTARDDHAETEGWILVAACAAIGVQHGSTQQRRRDQAVERARALDADHPRLALIEAWAVNPRAAAAPQRARDEAAAKLAVAAERFRSWRRATGAPEWGEAEVLALLGELHLQRGDTRAARDFIERALLAAPEYRVAVQLRDKLVGGTRP
jgi:hypothetical protein